MSIRKIVYENTRVIVGHMTSKGQENLDCQISLKGFHCTTLQIIRPGKQPAISDRKWCPSVVSQGLCFWIPKDYPIQFHA